MKNTIYVIEDNKDIGYILEYVLTEEGYIVRLFPDITTFNQAFTDEVPDLFLIDIMLPDGDGINLSHQIKKDSRAKKIPLILMSAHESGSVLSRESSADDFIPKPFDLRQVVQKISRCLHN